MNSQTPTVSDRVRPKVVIAGAGIGGLFLAIVLERAGIPYDIFERASEVKTFGSVMGLSANILPVLEQLGLFEEFKQIALPNSSVKFLYGNMQLIASLQGDAAVESIGYSHMIFSRQRLYQLLHSKVPSERIHFNKKIISTEQTDDGVLIQCEDGSVYHGDILVGADGAYSSVRESIYRSLKEDDLLPASDSQMMSKGYVCLVGTTDSLDPNICPLVHSDRANYHQIIYDGTPYSCTLFNVAENRLCYFIVRQFENQTQCDEEKLKTQNWGNERSAEMIEKTKDLRIPHDLTLGDLFAWTPKDKISRIYLEDKLFETWTHGRTVLVGDAAHKLLPSAGQGAICAMQDAVILSNCLYDLESLKPESIKAALEAYKEQRFAQVKIQFEQSRINATLYHGQTFWERCLRVYDEKCDCEGGQLSSADQLYATGTKAWNEFCAAHQTFKML
ncbi:hypothetical protein BGZ83_010456 [Gryganskiella cystojenkinii]|nr:hypothetical protein BGZ83_010456 [Gryganskiella cystojenkinii]